LSQRSLAKALSQASIVSEIPQVAAVEIQVEDQQPPSSFQVEDPGVARKEKQLES